MSRARRRIYYAIKNCIEALQRLKMQGNEPLIFYAAFRCCDREVNSIENASTEYFGFLMRQYDKTEEPDRVRVEFRDKRDVLLWSKGFLLSDRKYVNDFPKLPDETEILKIIERQIANCKKFKNNEA